MEGKHEYSLQRHCKSKPVEGTLVQSNKWKTHLWVGQIIVYSIWFYSFQFEWLNALLNQMFVQSNSPDSHEMGLTLCCGTCFKLDNANCECISDQ